MTLSVSVVIPAHNAAPFVAAAIESVLGQTRPAGEILVVDDASSDATAEVVGRYPVTLLQLPPTRGPSAARNAGIAAATGDVVAFLDADDIWYPHHLEQVVGLLDRHPDAVVAYSGIRFVGTREGVWQTRLEPDQPFEALERVFDKSGQPPQITAVVRRAALLEVGGYHPAFRQAQDYELWLRLARVGPFVCIREVTADYRYHSGQISQAYRIQQTEEVFTARAACLARLAREDQAMSARLSERL
ncbi:MAG: glycosyltransferase, partial [Gemmatimonadetes bacterium]|nr:glycosyltransferase [Gemmatimonadota bacterium]